MKKDVISFEGSENNKIKKEGYFLVKNFFPVFSNNEKEVLEEFNKMSKKDRTLFHKKDRADALNKVIPFGEKRKFSSNCSLQQILRIDLVTDGGTFTYEFNQY
ncbi:hypothetical protein [Campylobacter sp. CCS1377]|uniref:Uncharacterized protein n=1 Tax=Campylobacter sp. CCS1377 TaxID=3158229 RepID=A0AAU7E3S2_9BACT|nr:hypothetical protein [Campylobacter jejuni]